jgi:F0F1-type ATP synthase assembly protein I
VLILRIFSRKVSPLRNGPRSPGQLIIQTLTKLAASPFLASLKKDKSDERRSYLRQSGLLATVPFLLAVPPIAGLLIGRFLDQKFNTDPILTIILLILGFIAGGREVASVVKKANAMEERNKDKRK